MDVEGITAVTAADVAAAREMGFVIKLLAIAELIEADGGAGVCVRVHPTMVPETHPLAGVRDAFNAVFIEADAAGQVMFYGRGAGGAPTASAVLGDIVTAARNRVTGLDRRRGSPRTPSLPGAADGRGHDGLLRPPAGRSTGPASWPRSPGCSPSTASASAA